MAFTTPTATEKEHIKETIQRFSADVEERSSGMDYFNGLTRDGIEAVGEYLPGFLDYEAWNETPALYEMLTALDEVVASFGGSYTLHGYAKYDFQPRLTVEGFEYIGTERGVGALVYKYRKADEVVIKGDRGPEAQSSVYVWWD
jgi:hypothetical protein